MIWRIRADMRNQGYNTSDWIGKTLYYVITRRVGTGMCSIRHGKLTDTPNSLKLWFVMMISHLFSSLSFSSSTLPSPQKKKLHHPSLSLHAIIEC